LISGIKRRRPLRDHSVVLMPRNSKLVGALKILVVLILILAIPLSAWLAWEAALRSQTDVKFERDRLLVQREELVAELTSTRERAQQLEVDLLVALESVTENRGMVQELEQQLFHVQQDLAQYQGVLEPAAASPGVRIQAFELLPTEDPDRFRYKIMVSRVGEEEDTFQARLLMQIHGLMDGEMVSLPLADLTEADDAEGIALNFRYFQVVPSPGTESELLLPEGFEPKRVELQALQNGSAVVERSFEWTDAGVP
tara:strand:+ start:24574 stop:25338 length:765 start_codon:yes stop_codon:yes gene_type:complete